MTAYAQLADQVERAVCAYLGVLPTAFALRACVVTRATVDAGEEVRLEVRGVRGLSD